MNILNNEKLLKEEYVNNKKSINQLSKEYGVSKFLLKKAIVSFNIIRNDSIILDDYDILYNLYINENKSVSEISDMYNNTIKVGVIYRLLKKYKILKPKESVYDGIKENNIKKYGVSCAMQNSNIKNKIIENNIKKYGCEYPLKNKEVRDKIKSTNLEKYGCENPFQRQDVKDKIKQTNLEKYGVDNPAKSQDIKDKIKSTNLEKYGSESIFLSEKYKNDIKNIYCEKYGVDNPMKCDEIKEKAKNTRLNKYGREYKSQIDIPENSIVAVANKDNLKEFIKNNFEKSPTMHELSKKLEYSYSRLKNIIREYDLYEYISFNYGSSHYENEIYDYLKSITNNSIIQNDRKMLSNLEIDILIPELKIGIEFDGSYWHSDLHKDKMYHYNKSKDALDNGIFIYHIFEYEWNNNDKKEKIINQLKNILQCNDNKIYGRNTTLKIVSSKEKSAFLNQNHIQGNDRSTINLGLYYDEKLVSIMTFTKPRFNKNYTWELSRYCSLANTTVVGGASKLFKYFVDTYLGENETIISYSDIAKTKGVLYEKLGFSLDHISEPNYIWWRTDTDFKTRYQCQMKDENKIMTENGYIKIYDCGNKVWIYKKT